MNRSVLLILTCLMIVEGCAVGHKDYLQYMDSRIGKVMPFKEPFKFNNAGEYSRGNFVITGQGLTFIEQGIDGDLIYHFSDQEILPHYRNKDWVGKCLIYEVVDPETYIIKAWGFDDGGNPLSCRTWP